MKAEDAVQIAQDAVAFCKKRGAESAIVMVCLPDGELHHAYGAHWHGRTLTTRGLLDYAGDELRADGLRMKREIEVKA